MIWLNINSIPGWCSSTCWTPTSPTDADASAQTALVQSSQPEIFLGTTQFFVDLMDENSATGGQYVGNLTVQYNCRYVAV